MVGTRLTEKPGAGLRVAVLGGGMIGRAHAESARRAGGEVTAVLGTSPDRAAAAAEATGAARSFTDLDELFARARPDVVHVCTPNTTHAEFAAACLEADTHVVCEKPLAPTEPEARELSELADRTGRLASVPFVYRFHPMAREMRARVAAGESGIIVAIHGGYLQDWMSRATDDNWRADPDRSGPSQTFADVGSHWCDFLEFVLGDRVTAVSACTATTHPNRGPAARPVTTEDTVTLQLRTGSGVPGTAVMSQAAAGRKNHMFLEISGTEATLRFEQETPDQLWRGTRVDSRTVLRDPETLAPDAQRYCLHPAGHAQGYQDCFDAFVADSYAVARGQDFPEGLPTFSDGWRATRITEAVLASAAADGSWTPVTQ